ncbi:formimidoylglutamate deiminase [Oleiagrimonas soli]|uniref:Formimidoylglutamate deiminase n=1 Tax=Oleiagrimonas soli TaxID=1543381 RepID=A0A099CVG5_9GAMM|nr:formimidoylglutamate deiminase [Oleiagrimonas soli]KGI77671.1 N-formimino-L-glutamate deiminase [Oleiagrimonas soli]MBB6182805.1 formimidoylglutamate deiminase [Oleiagrimonas soli]
MDRTTLRVDHLWRDGAWQRDVRIGVEETGALGAPDEHTEQHLGWVLPGMPNLHSHAFQRAMAGLAERRGPGDDSFWTWREAMYAFASRIGPDALKAIAAQLYVEMLKAGYTHVCEFHYLHQQPDGRPYADAAAMSRALIAAADEAGIGMTLLPVLYLSGGFDGRPLSERQRRFGLRVDAYLQLIETLRREENPMLRVGAALHSLRAVPEAALREVLAAEPLKQGPIHIHIAEQIGEVQDCLAVRNARPVQWLLDHAAVDARWCLVHATHLDRSEIARLAASGAVAGLCPTTEANLGDGLFPLAEYLDAGGRLGIGSDSHISVSPKEDLRWLEYGQRLRDRHRNIAARRRGASVGETLWQAATAGGAQAADMPLGACAEGRRADLLVLDDDAPQLAARDAASMLDSFLFAGNAPLVRDVMVGGVWVVRDFRHRDEARIAARYRGTVETLRATA